MNKVVLVFVVSSIIMSCTVESLSKKEIDYIDLPQPVKKALFNDSYEYLRELNTPKRYEYSSRQHILMPWNYTGYISEKGGLWKREINTNRKYGHPYIIYEDSLYLPNQWNIIPKDSLSYTFTRFILR